MANTLTGLIPNLYEAMDVVSRELVGLIPSVTHDMSAARAAVGQSVISFVAPSSTPVAITPGVTAPNSGDQTIGNVTWTITNAEAVPVRWNGEESRSIDNGGHGRRAIMVNQFAQAMRALTNKVELGGMSLYAQTSRAHGTAGTTPFASDVSASARVRKILDDNGAPLGDRTLVIDTAAGANLRTLANLTKANEAGTADILRQGTLIDLHGFAIRESAQAQTPAKGTGTSYTTSAAGFAVGTTSIPIITGSGTVLAGDVVTFAGDTNQYVVATGVAAPGTIVLAAPGLRVAIPASATAMTILNVATRNMAFHRSAIGLATRAPAVPDEGDMADDATIITDPKSGLSFEVRLYKQYRQVYYEVALAWGWKILKPEHTALVLG
jgi:hypothetical protein